jgi:hypothetical protein
VRSAPSLGDETLGGGALAAREPQPATTLTPNHAIAAYLIALVLDLMDSSNLAPLQDTAARRVP